MDFHEYAMGNYKMWTIRVCCGEMIKMWTLKNAVEKR